MKRKPPMKRKYRADPEPLVVTPRQACVLLGIGNSRLYQLLTSGELPSYQEGRGRRITMASIRARIERLSSRRAERARARAAHLARYEA